jgi:hypothetical protein
MVENIVAKDDENIMHDIQDKEEDDHSLPKSSNVDLIQVNQDAKDNISLSTFMTDWPFQDPPGTTSEDPQFF